MDPVTTAELGLRIDCPACDTPAGTVCTPPPAGSTTGRLHNVRTRYGKTLRLVAAPDSTLADALAVFWSEVLRTWDPPRVADLAALPLTHPDALTRRVIRGRIRSFAIGIAERAAAGESEEQLDRRVERATRRIVTQDSGVNHASSPPMGDD